MNSLYSLSKFEHRWEVVYWLDGRIAYQGLQAAARDVCDALEAGQIRYHSIMNEFYRIAPPNGVPSSNRTVIKVGVTPSKGSVASASAASSSSKCQPDNAVKFGNNTLIPLEVTQASVECPLHGSVTDASVDVGEFTHAAVEPIRVVISFPAVEATEQQSEPAMSRHVAIRLHSSIECVNCNTKTFFARFQFQKIGSEECLVDTLRDDVVTDDAAQLRILKGAFKQPLERLREELAVARRYKRSLEGHS
jgi:hypothetical protein